MGKPNLKSPFNTLLQVNFTNKLKLKKELKPLTNRQLVSLSQWEDNINGGWHEFMFFKYFQIIYVMMNLEFYPRRVCHKEINSLLQL